MSGVDGFVGVWGDDGHYGRCGLEWMMVHAVDVDCQEGLHGFLSLGSDQSR